MGDHALVFMYQPYKGAWIQIIGALLSKGADPNKVLENHVVDAILLTLSYFSVSFYAKTSIVMNIVNIWQKSVFPEMVIFFITCCC